MLFIGSAFPRFHAGKNDMIQILKKNDIYYETYVFDDAPHSFWLFHP
jgi:pectinesterase